MITAISKLGNVRVISLASDASGQRGVAALKAVLGNQTVDRILTGTVLRSGGRVRIDAQLIDPKTQTVHWANYYERNITDVLELESAVAAAIASEIPPANKAATSVRPFRMFMIILQNARTPSLTRSFRTPMRGPVYDGLVCGVIIAPWAPGCCVGYRMSRGRAPGECNRRPARLTTTILTKRILVCPIGTQGTFRSRSAMSAFGGIANIAAKAIAAR